jgi:uncharacterized membrane protein YjjP (DUF1212 family)
MLLSCTQTEGGIAVAFGDPRLEYDTLAAMATAVVPLLPEIQVN